MAIHFVKRQARWPPFFIAFLKCSKHNYQLDQVLENFKYSFYFDGITLNDILGTFNGLRLDACFSLAETLGRVHNEWRENAKLSPQTTDNRLRTKSEGQLYTKQTQNLF